MTEGSEYASASGRNLWFDFRDVRKMESKSMKKIADQKIPENLLIFPLKHTKGLPNFLKIFNQKQNVFTNFTDRRLLDSLFFAVMNKFFKTWKWLKLSFELLAWKSYLKLFRCLNLYLNYNTQYVKLSSKACPIWFFKASVKLRGVFRTLSTSKTESFAKMFNG